MKPSAINVVRGTAERFRRKKEVSDYREFDDVLESTFIIPAGDDYSGSRVNTENLKIAAEAQRNKNKYETRKLLIKLGALGAVCLTALGACYKFGDAISSGVPHAEINEAIPSAQSMLSNVELSDKTIVVTAEGSSSVTFETSLDVCAALIGCNTIPGSNESTTAQVNAELQITTDPGSITLLAEQDPQDPSETQIRVLVDTDGLNVQIANENNPAVQGERGFTSRVANSLDGLFDGSTGDENQRANYVENLAEDVFKSACGEVLMATESVEQTANDASTSQDSSSVREGNALAAGIALSVRNDVNRILPLFNDMPEAREVLEGMIDNQLVVDFGPEGLRLDLPDEIETGRSRIDNVNLVTQAQDDCLLNEEARQDLNMAVNSQMYRVENSREPENQAN